MKIIQQTLSTLFVLILFLLAVSILYAADTEKVIIEENPELISDSDRDYDYDRDRIRDRDYDVDRDVRIDRDRRADDVVESEIDDDSKVRTTVTTVTETETVPNTAGPTNYNYDPDEDIEVDVQMEDKVFQPNQNVEGQIIVHNTTPKPLPATFHVKLFHDNKLFRHVRVQTADKLIQPGITRYDLDEFGIPDLNKNRNYSGEWTIMVYQDDPRTSEEENFRLERIDI